MPTSRAARRLAFTLAALALGGVQALARADTLAPVTSLSPDERPTLIIVAAPAPLLIAHHPQPLSPDAAEALALDIGLSAAGPIIRRHARSGLDPLPPAWDSGESDRGFTAALAAALDRPQANWPWRDLEIVASKAKARAAAARLAGEDVVVVTFACQLEDRMTTVQYRAQARVLLLRDVGTPQESRTELSVRHLSRKLAADWGRPRASAAVFRPGGPLDQEADAAALDLSRALAVTIARLTTATPSIRTAGREFSQLAHKPDCPECEPSDPVLHQEPGRVWVAPARLAGTILSLPVEPQHARVASDRSAPADVAR
ncbi:MAG: hypothetical protein ACRETB_03580 [Steroidobacteraceae bacterium]